MNAHPRSGKGYPLNIIIWNRAAPVGRTIDFPFLEKTGRFYLTLMATQHLPDQKISEWPNSNRIVEKCE